MLIVDSSVWIDLINANTNLHTVWLEHEIRRQRIGVPDLILCEILRGIRQETAFRRVRDLFREYEVLHCGGETVAVAAAENFRFLQRKGITVRKTIDCLIATLCINEDHSLLHRDRDFTPFEELLGLRVVHPIRQ